MESLNQERQALSQAIRDIQRSIDAAHCVIVDGLSFKQYRAWGHKHQFSLTLLDRITKRRRLLEQAEFIERLYREKGRLISSLEWVLDTLDRKENLKLVESKPYSWSDRKIKELNQKNGIRTPNRAGLKLIG